jgi:hypothetical protein
MPRRAVEHRIGDQQGARTQRRIETAAQPETEQPRYAVRHQPARRCLGARRAATTDRDRIAQSTGDPGLRNEAYDDP